MKTKTLVLLSTILVFTFLSCWEESAGNPVELKAGESTVFVIAEQQPIVFSWEANADIPTSAFRLYKMSAKRERSMQKGNLSYNKLFEKNLNGGEGVIKYQLPEDIKLDVGEIYIWEVAGTDARQTPVTTFSNFAVVDSEADVDVMNAVLVDLSCDCPEYEYNAQCQVVNTICLACRPAIHTVNLDGGEFFGGGGSMRLAGITTDPYEPCVLTTADSVFAFFDFTVNVPSDKVSQAGNSLVELYLFKGDQKVPVNRYQMDLQLNLVPVTSSQLKVEPADYTLCCLESGAVCGARVNIWLKFPVEFDPDNPANYYFVFFLPPADNHHVVHVGSSVGVTQNQARARQTNAIHSTPSDCTQPANTLAYYSCIDALSSHHLSKHTEIVEIPLCF